MCIIVVKPSGVDMPDSDTLAVCEWMNPDGSGFMVADGESVRIRKGFMSFKEFSDALERETDGHDVRDLPIIMHFRIATHGDVTPGCCHPFPITDDELMLAETECDVPIGIAHNGVISGMHTGKTRSDTMDFIARYVTPLSKIAPDFIHSDDAADLLGAICDSKLAIMDKGGDIMLVGNFIEEDGVMYSNSTYKMPKCYSTSPKSLVGSNWGYGYEPYGYYGDTVSDLIDMLPYGPCATCYMGEECALTAPECASEQEAVEAEELYDELWYEDWEDEGKLTLKAA